MHRHGSPMLPNPDVILHADGSATPTPEEFANVAHLVGGRSASTTAPPLRRHRVVDNYSSSSEDDLSLVERVRRRSMIQMVRNEDIMSRILGGDELAAILSAIGMDDESRSSACQDAKAWCVLSRSHWSMCDRNPQMWQILVDRIFGYDEDPSHIAAVLGEGLIYRTFRDKADPKKAFERMCTATGLANVLAKDFELAAIHGYSEMMWDKFYDRPCISVTGMRDALKRMSQDERETLAVDYFPDIGRTEEWQKEARELFWNAPSYELYIQQKNKGQMFSKLIAVLFKSTLVSLFEDGNIFAEMARLFPYRSASMHCAALGHDLSNRPARRAFSEIGKLLGVYIVCLLQLERDVVAFEKEHDTSVDEVGYAAHLAEEMHVNIQNLRVQIAYAQDLILDPAGAKENTDYDTYSSFQQDMHDFFHTA